jgi:hypothetical protein
MPEDRRKKMAAELMRRSEKSKEFASKQEAIGKAQIKNNVKPNSMEYRGNVLPVGKERLDIASKARQDAKRDSMVSVGLSKSKPVVIKASTVNKPMSKSTTVKVTMPRMKNK